MADIFQPVDDQTTQLDPNADYLTELVGEGKKFKDAQALAKSKMMADRHITNLETELEETRLELKQRIGFQEAMDQLKLLNKPVVNEPSNIDTPDQSERKDVLTPEQLEALLERKLTERESKNLQERNQNFVQSELVKHFGSEEIARSEINRKAKELDISPDVLKSMAQKTPKAFLALVVEAPRNVNTSVPKSSIVMSNEKTFNPTGSKKQSYWNNLKKSDPKSYYSKEASIERHNQAISLGEAYFDV